VVAPRLDVGEPSHDVHDLAVGHREYRIAVGGEVRELGVVGEVDTALVVGLDPVEAFLTAARDGDFDALVWYPALINGAAGWVSVLDGELYPRKAFTKARGKARKKSRRAAPAADPLSPARTALIFSSRVR
jgi:hypothetical protein